MQHQQQRKSAACIHCRQMKLRCDAHERFPGSCSRCLKSQLRCSIDPSFKRTSQRQRIEIMEKELQSLKQSYRRAPGSASLPQNLDSSTPNSTDPSSSGPSIPGTRGSSAVLSPRILEDIQIDPPTISELLNEYYLHYHMSLPILPDLHVFLDSYASCDVLFWTVMAIASRGMSEYAELYKRLTEPVRRLATDLNAAASHSFPKIQALLLICCWPFPFGAVDSDPSWTYSGLATHHALRLGLHRPRHQEDFLYAVPFDTETLILREKTWFACFIINQGLSARLGIPATVRPDKSILDASALPPSWLSETFSQHLQVAYQAYKYSITLGHYEATTTGLLPQPTPVIHMFESNLRMTEARFSHWPNMELAMLLGSRLKLYSYILSSNKAAEINASPPISYVDSNAELLIQAYSAAIRLLQTVGSADADFPYWTSLCQSYIIYGVFFLLKLLTYPLSDRFIDEIAVRNAIHQSWELFQANSRSESDHMSRVCAAIQYLSKEDCGRAEARVGRPALRVRSRMAGNIYIDATWRAKARFSRAVRERRPDDYTAAEIEASRMAEGSTGTFSPSDFEGLPADWIDLFGDFW